jgi:hypothetical protein
MLLVYTSRRKEMAVYISTGGLDGVHRMVGFPALKIRFDRLHCWALGSMHCIAFISLYKKSKKWSKEI